MRDAKTDAGSILNAALASVDPVPMIARRLRLDGDILHIDTETQRCAYDLSRYRHLWLLGAGKASARMALGLEGLLGDRIAGGCVVVKDGYEESLARVTLLTAGHPVPDDRSSAAAGKLLELAGAAGPDDLVLVVLSGGGSALAAAPYAENGHAVTLADKQAVTRALLACGATIQEINCVRKKLSAIKGGRLAKALAPAQSVTLILSDVVGDDLPSIASGPTVADDTTAVQALAVLERYGLAPHLPPAVTALVRAMAEGAVAAGPDADDPCFATARTVVVGSNVQALLAARDAARSLGYAALVLTSRLTGEAREVAHLFSGLARDIVAHGVPLARPACIIAGGETTVTLRGKGLGGRNQELALAFLEDLFRGSRDIGEAVLLAAATDGGDGPTGAAGAFASRAVLERGLDLGLQPATLLADNDAYHYFSRLGQLLVTGPTKTNVCDITLLVSP